jgi:hypothetical protein
MLQSVHALLQICKRLGVGMWPSLWCMSSNTNSNFSRGVNIAKMWNDRYPLGSMHCLRASCLGNEYGLRCYGRNYYLLKFSHMKLSWSVTNDRKVKMNVRILKYHNVHIWNLWFNVIYCTRIKRIPNSIPDEICVCTFTLTNWNFCICQWDKA